MSETFTFEWSGKAVGVNKRLMKTKLGRFMLSPEYRQFKKDLALCINASQRPVSPLRAPLRVYLYQRANHDCDALVKPVMDALEDTRVIKNDKQVTRLMVQKFEKDKRTDMDEIEVRVESWKEKTTLES